MIDVYTEQGCKIGLQSKGRSISRKEGITIKNAFDPKGNFSEWIQNDWESDDFIEQQEKRNRSQPVTEPEQDGPPPKAWHGVLAVLITLLSNPLIWIVVVIIILIKT